MFQPPSPGGALMPRIIEVDFTALGTHDLALEEHLLGLLHKRCGLGDQLIIDALIEQQLTVRVPGEWDEQEVREKLFDTADQMRLDRHLTITHIDVQKNGSYVPIQVVRGSDVTALTPEPFVSPYIFHNSLHLLVGDPGTGKSLIILHLLARASRGMSIFGSKIPQPLNVMMLSNEDSPEVSMARYQKFFGDPNRIMLERFDGKTFALAHMSSLEALVIKHKPKILVIDSLMSHVGGDKDVYRGNVMSSMLAPLEALAENRNVIVFALMHMNKQDAAKIIYRVGGSVAIVGSARSVLLLADHPSDSTRRVVGHIKSNYARKGDAFEMSVIGHEDGLAVVKYEDKSEIKIEELFQKPDSAGGGKKVQEAQDFLETRLLESPMPANEMYEEALKQGISDTSLERAKKKLKIQSVRSLDNSRYLWATKDQAERIKKQRENMKKD
jgi:RecA-family ATPase